MLFDTSYIKGYFMQIVHWHKKGWMKNADEYEEVRKIKETEERRKENEPK